MIRDPRAGVWIETALFALASVLLAQMGLGVFLFLVPLQVLYARRGTQWMAVGATGAVAAVAVIRIVGATLRGALAQTSGLLVVELFAVGALALGLVLVDAYEGRPLPLAGRSLRAVPRLFAATGLTAVLSVFLLLLLRRSPEMMDSVQRIFRDAADTIAGIITQSSGGLQAGAETPASPLATRMYEIALEVFPRTYLLYYFVILAFSRWAGRKSASRASGRAPSRLVQFALPEGYIWPLIVSLALVLADIAFGARTVGYVGWNAGLIMLFVYGLQGLGIIQFAFARFAVGRTFRAFAYVLLAVLFVSPGANLVVTVGLAGLGVSEIWLKYRTRRRNTDADEGHP